MAPTQQGSRAPEFGVLSGALFDPGRVQPSTRLRDDGGETSSRVDQSNLAPTVLQSGPSLHDPKAGGLPERAS